MSGTAYCSYPILPFGIVACTFFPTTFLEIAVYKVNDTRINVCSTFFQTKKWCPFCPLLDNVQCTCLWGWERQLSSMVNCHHPIMQSTHFRQGFNHNNNLLTVWTFLLKTLVSGLAMPGWAHLWLLVQKTGYSFNCFNQAKVRWTPFQDTKTLFHPFFII